MATVNWADASEGGKKKDVPMSFYQPLIVLNEKKLWQELPKNAVPNGMGNKDQLIGYWYEVKREAMSRGKKVSIPSKWYFYYLGTGPHESLKFRTRTDGVVWVAVNGAKTSNTGLGTRSRNQKAKVPQFNVALPSDIVIADSGNSSRSNSRSRSRGRSGSRGGPSSRNSDRTENLSSRSPAPRGLNQNQKQQNSGAPFSKEELMSAVRTTLKEFGLGLQNKSEKSADKPQKAQSKSRSNTPTRSPANVRKQLDKEQWKRVPNKEEDVTKCFGPRDLSRNFGDNELCKNGAEDPRFPGFAELTPSIAAILLDSEVSSQEKDGDHVEIQYHYKMTVSKNHPRLAGFLAQICAFTKPSEVVKMQKSAESASQLSPQAPVFTPAISAQGGQSDVQEEVDIIDEILN
ncbi:nucleocapsid protein [Bat alphacoronavirus]|uniref:Nucleoprotein n=1 Tax=bat alphacoronavirus isolate AMA_L_F TaxID=3070181 RepID=A0AA48V7C8_9ALPC|nr:nucleocapsid protein [Bat alphacoronavirus]QLE11829.1 nucleocapsid protein [bat alphacoronavirus isolate AMA_L_F]